MLMGFAIEKGFERVEFAWNGVQRERHKRISALLHRQASTSWPKPAHNSPNRRGVFPQCEILLPRSAELCKEVGNAGDAASFKVENPIGPLVRFADGVPQKRGRRKFLTMLLIAGKGQIVAALRIPHTPLHAHHPAIHAGRPERARAVLIRCANERGKLVGCMMGSRALAPQRRVLQRIELMRGISMGCNDQFLFSASNFSS